MEKTVTLCDYECDCSRRVKPGFLLRHVQQISTDHCDMWGLTAERYEATSTAFLMAKLSLRITGDAFIGDTLRLVTQPAAPRRAIFCRYTDILNARGQSVASVDARWVLVDRQSHRILRQPPEGLCFPALPEQVPTHDFAVKKAADAAPCGRTSASFCRCDVNGHLNNAEYADIVCDSLPQEDMVSRPLASLCIAYHHELRMGGEMELFRAGLDGGYYLLGRSADAPVFEANAFFR